MEARDFPAGFVNIAPSSQPPLPTSVIARRSSIIRSASQQRESELLMIDYWKPCPCNENVRSYV